MCFDWGYLIKTSVYSRCNLESVYIEEKCCLCISFINWTARVIDIKVIGLLYNKLTTTDSKPIRKPLLGRV